MPLNRNFDRRKIKIDEYLRNGLHQLTLAEITEKLIIDLGLETLDKRTVQDDIKHLKKIYNAPIVSKRSGTKTIWKYDDENFSINKIPVETDELYSLQQAVDIISAMKTFSVSKRLQAIVLKLTQTERLDDTVSDNAIQFETNEHTQGYQYFDQLYESIKEGVVLQITYQRFTSEAKREFFIHPYLLKEFSNRWYVVCLIDGKNDIATFALDRILKIKNSSKPFRLNKYFKPEHYFNNVIGIYRKKEDKPVKIKIKVAENQVAYFNSQPLHHTQKAAKPNNDGSVLMEYDLIINLELKQLLLSYAGSIKVIEPDGLKEEIKAIIKDVC